MGNVNCTNFKLKIDIIFQCALLWNWRISREICWSHPFSSVFLSISVNLINWVITMIIPTIKYLLMLVNIAKVLEMNISTGCLLQEVVKTTHQIFEICMESCATFVRDPLFFYPIFITKPITFCSNDDILTRWSALIVRPRIYTLVHQIGMYFLMKCAFTLFKHTLEYLNCKFSYNWMIV